MDRGKQRMVARVAMLAFTVWASGSVAAWPQVVIPPDPAPETLEVPSLEEELGGVAPWTQTPSAEAVPPPAETEAERRAKTVRLNGLDKITGRIMSFDAAVDTATMFGALKITARTCHKRPPEETPETTAYLEITDSGPASQPGTETPAGQPIFSGWMFASSPALSALEHPIYDVWVIDCIASRPGQGSGRE